MRLSWQISAGEFFELLRPAALASAAILSAWVLANARRWGFRFHWIAASVAGTFLLPFVVLPLYLIARASRKRRTSSNSALPETQSGISPAPSAVKFRFVLPLAYCLVVLSLIGLYLYRNYNSTDGHLARAVQARLVGQQEKTVREYRAALALEENPHTHKLLGIELAEMNRPEEALREFRLAERGGEPDESLPFRIGQAYDALGDRDEASLEFKRFLESQACRRLPADERCEGARVRTQSPR